MNNPYDKENAPESRVINDLETIERLGESANLQSVTKAAYLFAKKAFNSKSQIDANKAFKYAERASNRGSAEAAILLSSFYLIGLGCEKSFKDYEQWITKVNKHISILKIKKPRRANYLASKRKSVIGATKNYMTVEWR